MPHGAMVLYDPLVISDLAGTFYTDLDAEILLFNTLFIGGGVKTTVWKFTDSDWTFFPNKAVYSFSAGLRRGPLELGFRHYCIHPVIPYFSDPDPIWEGAFDEVYLRIEGGG